MIRTLLLGALLGVAALAQGPQGAFPWWDSPLARDMTLSDDQKQRIQSTIREHRNRLIDLRGAAEKAEAELEDVYSEERVDERRAAQAIDRVVAARGDLMREVSLMSMKLRSVLSLEQWRDLQKRRQAMREDRRQGRRPRRPGMPPEGGPDRGGPPPQE